MAGRRLNRHRNGYRMPCKPPWTSTATAWFPVRHAGPSTRIRPARAYPETAPGEASPGAPGPLAHGLPASPATDGPLRRNAVGAHGVKLDAAPDAPSWGEVPACSPPVPVRIQRSAAAVTDTHPSPHRHTCQARTVLGGTGCEAVQTCPAVWACRGCLKSAPVPVVVALAPVVVPRTVAVRVPTVRGWQTAEQLARPIGRSVIAGGNGRICGRHPRPGKDPS